MDNFSKIIGYEGTKETLRLIGHILRNTDAYRDAGAALPKGLLLSGQPGTGKTSLCECLIRDSGRKAIILRKDNDEDFLASIRDAFEKAKELAPSILLLEDMDKYSDRMSCMSSEWAALQTAIDESKDCDLFVLATINDSSYIASSLLRPGRFDYILEIEIPRGETAEKIMKHYLKDKKLGKDVLISDIAKVLSGKSCATLETVANAAALNSIYDGSKVISKKHMCNAILQIVHQARRSDMPVSKTALDKIAWHEAAHALVAEILEPGMVSFVSIVPAGSTHSGITSYYTSESADRKTLLTRVKSTLAGRAIADSLFGELDTGAESDLQTAFEHLYNYVVTFGGCGITYVDPNDIRTSDMFTERVHNIVSGLMEECYREAKETLARNMDKLTAVHDALLKDETLLSSDMEKIIK